MPTLGTSLVTEEGTLQVDIDFELSLVGGHTDANLIEGAFDSLGMKRSTAPFASHDAGDGNLTRFASLLGLCKMTGIKPTAHLRDLFFSLADAASLKTLMPSCHWFMHPRIRAPQ